MDENYFMTLRDYVDLGHRVKELWDEVYELRHRDTLISWCKDDPKVDELRRNAANALEAYYDALDKIGNKEKDRLYDKLDNSDKVIILDNLFKKGRRP